MRTQPHVGAATPDASSAGHPELGPNSAPQPPPRPLDFQNPDPQDFFETCAILITVVVLGKYLECSAKGRTSEAIKVRVWRAHACVC
jgi:hypothetical protein